jgi:hypothetical protein
MDETLPGTYTSILQACKAAAVLDNVPSKLTMEEFQGKIKAWKEGTSTSQSGLHLGRYKALFSKSIYCSELRNTIF